MPSLMDSRDQKPAPASQIAAPTVAPVPFVKVARGETGRPDPSRGNAQAWQNWDGSEAVPLTETTEKASGTNVAAGIGKPKKKKIELMSELDFEEQDPVYFPSPAPKLVCGAGEDLEQEDYGADVSAHRPGRYEEISHPLPRWLRHFFCTADEPTLEETTSPRYSRRDSPVDFDDSQIVKSVAL